MLRPHSLESLEPSSFHAITVNGEDVQMPENPLRFRDLWLRIWVEKGILGFYINFWSKTMHDARAYFPTLSDADMQMECSLICPALALTDILRRVLMKKKVLKSLNKQKRLTLYLQYITCLDQYIAPYALRVGGRTWLLTQGIDRQLEDLLETWKSPESSARYYRASPQSVISSLRRFYFDVVQWRYT